MRANESHAYMTKLKIKVYSNLSKQMLANFLDIVLVDNF
jgi:hypothetical protein